MRARIGLCLALLIPSLAMAVQVDKSVTVGAYTDTGGGYPNSDLMFVFEYQVKHPNGDVTPWAEFARKVPDAANNITVAFVADGLPSDTVVARVKTVAVTNCKWQDPQYCESEYVYAEAGLPGKPGKAIDFSIQ